MEGDGDVGVPGPGGPLGCPGPRGQSDEKIRAMHILPPHDPSK